MEDPSSSILYAENYALEVNRMRNKNKGFTLIELVVVIGILVAMAGALVPALLGYTENTRADKDTSQMQEVATAIEMAMANEHIYDELLMYAIENNFSCYADGNPATNTTVNRKEDFNVGGNAEGIVGGEDLWSYDDDARALPKMQYTPSGNMCGVTITFVHDYSSTQKNFSLENALINNMSPAHKKSNTTKLGDLSLDGTTYLYNYLKRVVSEDIETQSTRYRNAEYTVFIRMVPPGVDYDKYEALPIEVYGQWSGTNINKSERRDALDEVDGVDAITPGSMGATPVAPVPVAPNDVGMTPQTPKEVATFIAPTVKQNLEYNEHAQELLNAGSSSEGTMYYKLRGGEWSPRVPRATDAGEYEVLYYVKGDLEHYNTQEFSLKVTIRKATPRYSVPTGKTNLYANGSSQELVVAGQVISGGAMVYKLSTTGYGTAVPLGKAPGDYTVIWKIQETDNYLELPEQTIAVKIGKMDSRTQAPKARLLTYTGGLLQLVDECVIDNQEIPTDLPIVEYSLDGQNWSQSVPYGKNAGDYYVYYRVNENAYYAGTDGTSSVKVTIAKANPNVTVQWNDDLTYAANTLQTFVDDVHKESETKTYFRMYQNGQTPGPFSEEYPAATEAGVYIIDWYVEGDDNFMENGTATAPNQKYITIKKAISNDVNKINVVGKEWVYDKQTYSAVVENGDGWTVTFDDGTNVTTTVPSATNAGTYNYIWTATHPNFDTIVGTVTLKCDKAPVVISKEPLGSSAHASGQIISYYSAAGQFLRKEYIPEKISLSGSVTPGECTEGASFTYDNVMSFTHEFDTSDGSMDRYHTVNWTLVPISGNYYIDGPSQGSVTIALSVTVTEDRIIVN